MSFERDGLEEIIASEVHRYRSLSMNYNYHFKTRFVANKEHSPKTNLRTLEEYNVSNIYETCFKHADIAFSFTI